MVLIDDAEKEKIKNFFDACNEMIDDRFILSDVKIAKILKCIATSEILYNFFAKCLINFKFQEEFENAKVANKVNGGYFMIPADEQKVIALVFCFLLEVDNQKINLQSFINEYFYNPDGYNISYANFALNMLVPFKNSVLNMLACNEDGSMKEEFVNQVEDEKEDEPIKPQEPMHKQKLLFANLRMSLNELHAAINRDFKIKSYQKEELNIVINALYEAISLENFKLINALIIPLEYSVSKNKNVKNYYEDFKNALVQFYYQ